MEVVIDDAEVRRMSLDQRRELARLLAELDGHPHDERPGRPNPGPDPAALANPYLTDARLRRQRRLALLVSAACCVVLAGWIVVIAATLPRHFDAHHWRAVWVNFDVFLFAAFAATAWAIWRERQVLILLLVGIGTMLCCDAWFDVGTSLATSNLWISLGSALVAELPLAFLAFAGGPPPASGHGRCQPPGPGPGGRPGAGNRPGRHPRPGRRPDLLAASHQAVRPRPRRGPPAQQPRPPRRRALALRPHDHGQKRPNTGRSWPRSWLSAAPAGTPSQRQPPHSPETARRRMNT